MLEFFNSVHQYTFDIFITGIDDITGNDEYNQESLDLETGAEEFYHGIMNTLQTNISSNVPQETEEVEQQMTFVNCQMKRMMYLPLTYLMISCTMI